MNINHMYINHVLTPENKADAVVVMTTKGQIYTEKINYLELGKAGIVVTTCDNDMVYIDFPNENVTVYMRHAKDPNTMTMFVFEDNAWNTYHGVTNFFIHHLFTTVTAS